MKKESKKLSGRQIDVMVNQRYLEHLAYLEGVAAMDGATVDNAAAYRETHERVYRDLQVPAPPIDRIPHTNEIEKMLKTKRLRKL